MNRREALTATATLLGVTITGANLFLSGCTPGEKKISSLADIDTSLLDEIGETIIPESASSPGAKTSHIGQFMKIMVADCYTEAEQSMFVKGVRKINDLSIEKYSKPFLELDHVEKFVLLSELDREAQAYGDYKNEEDPDHYFSMLKQLTLWGYFSSEPGATKALRYVPIPGRYEGCIDYDGGSAWLY